MMVNWSMTMSKSCWITRFCWWSKPTYPLVITHGVLERPSFSDGFPMQTISNFHFWGIYHCKQLYNLLTVGTKHQVVRGVSIPSDLKMWNHRLWHVWSYISHQSITYPCASWFYVSLISIAGRLPSWFHEPEISLSPTPKPWIFTSFKWLLRLKPNVCWWNIMKHLHPRSTSFVSEILLFIRMSTHWIEWFPRQVWKFLHLKSSFPGKSMIIHHRFRWKKVRVVIDFGLRRQLIYDKRRHMCPACFGRWPKVTVWK